MCDVTVNVYMIRMRGLPETVVIFVILTRNSVASRKSFWAPWTTWSACGDTCGGGVQTRYRDCKSGRNCPGNSKESRTCNTQPCEGSSQEQGLRRLPDEQRLLMTLMKNYDVNTRPVYNASHPVVVSVGLTLNQIFDVDERNQVLTTHIWLDQEWFDERLVWEPDDYNQLKVLRVPCHLIWKPDIVLYNSADDYKDGYMPSLAMVSSNGHVFWPPIVRLRSTCNIDITYFPFDDQTCRLKLGSWAYDGFQVDVKKRTPAIDLTNYVSNGEWELIDVKVIRNVVTYTCCPEPYPDVTFLLHMRRRTLYYTYNVIIPCVMLSCLTLLGFWMPPEGGEKVALGLTVLLAFSVFMLLIAENMPATSFYVPLIGVYIIVVMGLTCFAVFLAVFISHLHHQSTKNRPVPPWLRRFARRVARYVTLSKRHLSFNSDDTGATGCSVPDCTTPLQESFSNGNIYSGRTSEQTDEHRVSLVIDQNGKVMGNPLTEIPKTRKRPNRRRGSNNNTEDLVAKLDAVLNKHYEYSRQKTKDNTNSEWRDIADILDTLCFWVYFVITFSVTVIILVFIPMGKSVSIK